MSFCNSQGKLPRMKASFKVYSDTSQVATSSTASSSGLLPKPKRNLMHKAQPETDGRAAVKELNGNKDFVLSPNSRIRAEKENFDPTSKRFVEHVHRKIAMREAPLKERSHRSPSSDCENVTPFRSSSHEDRNKNQPCEYSAPALSKRNNGHSTLPNACNLFPERTVLARSKGQNGGNEGLSVQRGNNVKDLLLLLDDMSLSPEQRPLEYTNTMDSTSLNHPRRAESNLAMCRRLNLLPPAPVSSRKPMRSHPFATTNAAVRNNTTTTQNVAARQKNNTNSKSGAQRQASILELPSSYATGSSGRNSNRIVYEPQVLGFCNGNINSNSNSGVNNKNRNRTPKTQINTNILTPPCLRQSIR